MNHKKTDFKKTSYFSGPLYDINCMSQSNTVISKKYETVDLLHSD